jgi:hypothetical protein
MYYYTSSSEIEHQQAPAAAALKVLADARIDVVEADKRVRAMWQQLSAPDITMADVAVLPSGSRSTGVWNIKPKSVLQSIGCEAVNQTASLNYFNTEFPTWKTDDELTKATVKDRRVFMELVAESEDCADTINAHRHAIETVDKLLETLSDWSKDDASRYLGCYVTAHTSRRTVVGWVTKSSEKTITVFVDRAEPVNGLYTSGFTPMLTVINYRARDWIDAFMRWDNRDPDEKSESRFNLDVTKVDIHLPRTAAGSRRRLVSRWWREYLQAKIDAERDPDYLAWIKWLNEDAGKGVLERKKKIDGFDWNAKLSITPPSYYDEQQDWHNAALKVLVEHNLAVEVMQRTREIIFKKATGGPLTPAEQDILDAQPQVPYDSFQGAVAHKFTESGVLDPHRTLY